jgi:hypothetical protein
MTIFEVTFWKSDFAGENLDQLKAILIQRACEGRGYWFIDRPTHFRANMDEGNYDWIMENVANFGNPEINK